MPSYAITGATAGLGFEFVNQISSNPDNVTFAIVRRKQDTIEKYAKEFPDRKNIHIIEGNLESHKSLQLAADEVAKITGGSLDYLIANAGYISSDTEYRVMSSLAKDPEWLEEDLNKNLRLNTIGNMHLMNAFIPLIKEGSGKKVIAISSGHADLELVRRGLAVSVPYAMSKIALNMLVAKYHAEHGLKDGILFLSVCPSVVESHSMKEEYSEEEQATIQEVSALFAREAPWFKGPAKADLPVRNILRIMEHSSVQTGHGGRFISHLGTAHSWL